MAGLFHTCICFSKLNRKDFRTPLRLMRMIIFSSHTSPAYYSAT